MDTVVVLKKIHGLVVEESVAMFIHVLRGFKNRAIQERFQHSGETANNKSTCSTSSLAIKNKIPTFQGTTLIFAKHIDCIGAIDDMHVVAKVTGPDATTYFNTVTPKTSWQWLISTCVLPLYQLDGKAGNIMLLIRAILIKQVISPSTRATVTIKKIFKNYLIRHTGVAQCR
ncbi:hypothetical protein CsSME_00000249 [Camellia sinensis var. sinensis]